MDNPTQQPCEHFQALMSGLLDGELGPDESAELEGHLAACGACKAEFDTMKRLVSATSALRVEAPPDEVWDTFLEGVYNRLERRTGWIVFILGVVALALVAAYFFVVEPWGNALAKVLVAAPLIGLAVLFVSVLRQRLFVAKTDRYSKEVKR